jgi:hypothetical protein
VNEEGRSHTSLIQEGCEVVNKDDIKEITDAVRKMKDRRRLGGEKSDNKIRKGPGKDLPC